MEDFLINNEFKSDKYSVSLNELIFSRTSSSNISSLMKLLDDNGYFGRYKIESFSDKRFGTDVLIKIYVYMPDSSYTYCWPFNTFFNITRKLFGNNRKAPGLVLADQTMLKYSFLVLSVMFCRDPNQEEDYNFHDERCRSIAKIIKDGNHSVEEWAYIICKHNKAIHEKKYFQRVIAFLCRIGLIKNSRFLISGKLDAKEISSNLFDINYWYNI